MISYQHEQLIRRVQSSGVVFLILYELTEGLIHGDRYAVIYSPYAIGPGLDGVATWQSRGYQPADAHRIAVNILLYALRY